MMNQSNCFEKIFKLKLNLSHLGVNIEAHDPGRGDAKVLWVGNSFQLWVGNTFDQKSLDLGRRDFSRRRRRPPLARFARRSCLGDFQPYSDGEDGGGVSIVKCFLSRV